MELANNLEDMLKDSREQYFKLNYENTLSVPYYVLHKQSEHNEIIFQVILLKCFLNDIEGLIEYVKEEYSKIKELQKDNYFFIEHQEFIK